MILFNILVSIFFASAVLAKDSSNRLFHKAGVANTACTSLIGSKALYFPPKDEEGFCDVKNQPALGTYAHCLVQINETGSISNFIKGCENSELTTTVFWDSYYNATKYLTNASADPNFNITKLYNKPVILTQFEVDAAFQSGLGRWMNYNLGVYFGIILFCYWYGVLFFAGMYNLMCFIFPQLHRKLTGSFINCIRKYITLPALGRKRHAKPFVLFKVIEILIPTRLETILIAIWLVLVLSFNVSRYRHDSPNLFWPQSESAEIGRKIADRTGIMSLYLTPNLILFAGRNNFMQWLSGWSYNRFIMIHKWMARVAFILVLLHAVGMTFNGKGVGKYETRNEQPYVRWGYVALVCMSILVFHSLRIFRRNNYELFLLAHIIFAVFFIVGGWLHTEAVGFAEFFYAGAAVWVFDRVIRLGRLASFGVRPATVELIANETVKVSVKRPAYWKPYPGCHAFIHFVRPTMFWQSHPFTIIDSICEEKTITFYLKVKGGVTHGLYKYLAKQPGHKASIKVTVEGPYGQRVPIDRAQNAVFFVGGNGIPGLFYEAINMAKRHSEKQAIKFIWVIRHYKSLEWFYEELQHFRDTNVEPIIYVTQPDVDFPITKTDMLKKGSQEEKFSILGEKICDENDLSDGFFPIIKGNLPFIQFREGRPDVTALVRDEISNAHGSIAFATCAHESMVDDIRKAVANNLDASPYRVDLYEQIQLW